MNEKIKNGALDGLAILFFGWGVIAVLNSLYLLNPNQIFWNCYIGLLLIGLGIFMRNPELVGSQLAILAIPLIVWDVDFVYYLINKASLFGLTDYMFLEQRLAISQIISLQHLFTLPLALLAMGLMKVKKFDFWKISVVQIFLLFVIISLVTPPSENIGCVFENCMSVDFSEVTGIPYTLTWFLTFFVMIFITNFILWKLPFLRAEKVEREMFG